MTDVPDERAMTRTLRFLGKGGASMGEAAADGRVLLDGGERGVIGTDRRLVETMAQDGLVAVEAGAVRLTPSGVAALNRTILPSDPLLAQHRERERTVMQTEAGPETVTVNHAESPLALLWRRRGRDGSRFLAACEFHAGERLRADYSRGQIMPRLGVNWSAAGASGRKSGDANGIAGLTDAALAARMRVEKAIEAVGPELAGVLIDVCCFLKGLERVEAERGWPARSAKIVLKSALGALARHYEPPRSGDRNKAVLHWGADDYRPKLQSR